MKKYNTIFTLFISMALTAQVGVGTTDPKQVFHIDAASNNSTASADIRNSDDVVVSSEGKLGAGNILPVTRIDIRSNDNKENSIGIGTTNQTAAAAGTGAVKYMVNGSNWGLAYSDGNSWIFLPSKPIKALVYANKSSTQNINTNIITTITGWDEIKDDTASFNPATGVFTAPEDGVYIVSVNLSTVSGSISNNSSTETIVESNTTVGVPQFRCINSYPGYTTGNATNATGNNCTGIFYMNQGNTIIPRFLQNISSSRNLGGDGSLNTLTISQL